MKKHLKRNDPEEKRRKAAYRLMSSDVEAAHFLGITKATFCMWRRRRGLKAKHPQGRRLVTRSR